MSEKKKKRGGARPRPWGYSDMYPVCREENGEAGDLEEAASDAREKAKPMQTHRSPERQYIMREERKMKV